MQDNRQYIVKPLSYWTSPRAMALFRIKQSELDDAAKHPQGIIREEVERVLVVEQDARGYIEKKADGGTMSEVLKRHVAKSKPKHKE